MGRLTTHVLDTAAGRPAAGVALALCRIAPGGRVALATAVTNADGRTDEPLLAGPAFEGGLYELSFSVGAYFDDGGFYDVVPVRFRITDAGAHYHVPLLISPFGYSTYRGS
ncbi:hydroxyisourate hydrolase [Limibaculum sp. M0105]|uniref:5-hydroxyisourate hydrolase n=1 Tax=Thermohalobaculum xanthum TaxID=2753746 RepID=A0A8J7M5R3_9RHOB|nr:hydroxyisourate hydrolase [Thermohalobaculum xanthum]MBK0398959.1 hydroxyisourate hydrolase [Thermohalobaculum xanthum]